MLWNDEIEVFGLALHDLDIALSTESVPRVCALGTGGQSAPRDERND